MSKLKIYPDEVNHLKIAIPGKYTTANLLLNIAYPAAVNKQIYLFSDIEEVILSGEADAGLLIHENRFTYAKKGLKKIVDLGEYWENTYKQPIPLGGIVVNRSKTSSIQQKINRVLRRSIDFAYENPLAGLDFIKNYAQQMDEEIMYKHIELYVNDFTKQLGEKGKRAIKRLYNIAYEKQIIEKVRDDIFVA